MTKITHTYLIVDRAYHVLARYADEQEALAAFRSPKGDVLLKVHHEWGDYQIGDQVPRNVVSNTHIAASTRDADDREDPFDHAIDDDGELIPTGNIY